MVLAALEEELPCHQVVVLALEVERDAEEVLVGGLVAHYLGVHLHLRVQLGRVERFHVAARQHQELNSRAVVAQL